MHTFVLCGRLLVALASTPAEPPGQETRPPVRLRASAHLHAVSSTPYLLSSFISYPLHVALPRLLAQRYHERRGAESSARHCSTTPWTRLQVRRGSFKPSAAAGDTFACVADVGAGGEAACGPCAVLPCHGGGPPSTAARRFYLPPPPLASLALPPPPSSIFTHQDTGRLFNFRA